MTISHQSNTWKFQILPQRLQSKNTFSSKKRHQTVEWILTETQQSKAASSFSVWRRTTTLGEILCADTHAVFVLSVEVFLQSLFNDTFVQTLRKPVATAITADDVLESETIGLMDKESEGKERQHS